MLKGRLWKGILAAVLVLSMLPMVALADETANATTLDSVTYDGTKVTVKGTIKSAPAEGEGAYVAEADLTILAICSGPEPAVLDPTIGAEELQNRVVYIDQFNCQEEVAKGENGVIKKTGEFEISFMPREGATGGRFVTVFVGGTDVADPKSKVSEIAFVKNPGPKISADTWYKGSDLVLKLTKDGTNKFTNVTVLDENLKAITFTTKTDPITTITIAKEDVVVNGEAATITIPAAKLSDVTSITKITFDDGGYFDPFSFDGLITKESKPVPEIVETAVTLANANTTGTVEVTVTGEFANEWADHAAVAELAANETYTIVKTGTADAVKLSITPNDLKTVFENKNGIAKYEFTVPAGDFADAKKVSVTVTTAARAKLDAANIVVEYSDTEFYEGAPANTPEKDMKQGWGYAYPKAIDADGNYVGGILWSCEEGFGLKGELTRDAAVEKTYKVTATIGDNAYGDVTKDKELKVGKIGELGVDVTFTTNFAYDTAAKRAIVTIGDTTMVAPTDGTQVFKVSAIAPGDYTVTIARPGYITKTIEVTVDADGGAVVLKDEMPKMTAGELAGPTGELDGVINLVDLGAMAANWGASGDNIANLDGEGTVNLIDLGLMADGWGWGK